MRFWLFIPLTFFCYTSAICQTYDSLRPQTIHIQKKADNRPKLDTVKHVQAPQLPDTVTCIPMIGHTNVYTYWSPIKLKREEMLNAGSLTLRGAYKFTYGYGPMQVKVNGTYHPGMGWRQDTIKGQCNSKIVSYKMKFARRIANYQLKKVLKVDGKKYFLASNDAHFTDEMMNVIEAVPRGEKIMIYSIRVMKKDGEIKKLRRITLKLI
jgi:hypothetical protein